MKKYIQILIIISVIFTSCTKTAENSEKQETTIENTVSLTSAQLKSANISLGKPELKTLSNTIKVNGKIDVPPQSLVSVSVPMGGFVKSTKLLPGMHLKKGEVIAELEDQQYIELQQKFLTAKANLEMAEADFQRQKELNESKAGSDKVFQKAKADYMSLKIEISALSEKLKLININPKTLTEQTLSKSISLYAPFNGYVSKVNVNIGKYISPSDVLFELVDPSDIHLNLNVFEKDLIQLSIGQKLEAYTNSKPDQKHLCEIILISKDISSDRTAEVHCHFQNYDKNLLPGMYMNAVIDLKNTEVLAIPEEALVTYNAKNYAFIAQGSSTFQMVEATTGIKENGWIEILNQDDFKEKTIVTKGAYTLLMSLKNRNDE